ncbi:MAG: hypothetical protein FWG44_05005 [Oscillospiraceae bacterium]|nr:hypothetical protein [Oscillospiraceae bacterium]
MGELNKIMSKFAESGWDLIDKPAQEWLDGKKSAADILPVIKEADEQCGSCGCEMDPLYKKAIELLSA